MLDRLFSRFRWFRVRKYEIVDPLEVIKFIFAWSACGTIVFAYGCAFGDIYIVAGASFIFSSIVVCTFLPFRLIAPIVFSVCLFLYLYIELISFFIRFSVRFFGG